MAHSAQMNYVARLCRQRPEMFEGTSVLEVGSRDVNGTVRVFFRHPKRYVGLDCAPGKSVDVVKLAHEYHDPGPFDVVVSCEAFEHDPYLERSIANVMTMLRSGGLFVATCAGPARQEHGTENTTGEAYGPDAKFYRNVTKARAEELLQPFLDELSVEYAEAETDLYMSGVRK